MKWIFWTERKKRFFHRRLGDSDVWDPEKRRWITTDPSLPPLRQDEGWKPLKDFFYEMGFFGAFFFAFFAVGRNLEYFFPFWTPEFPAKSELLEVSGTLRFHHFHSRGKINYFTITPEQRGIGKVRLRCRSGPSGFSGYSCSDHNIPKNLDWSKTIARYHPQWGLIELVVDGFPVRNYTYELRKSFVEKMGRQAGYIALISFSIIIFYFARDLRLYRRRRAEYTAAAKARKKRVIPQSTSTFTKELHHGNP